MLIIEILVVLASFAVLVYCAVTLVKSAMSLGKTANRFMRGVAPKADHLVDQSQTAQRLAFSIMEGRDRLFASIPGVMVNVSKLMMLVRAAIDAWRPVSRMLRYVGL